MMNIEIKQLELAMDFLEKRSIYNTKKGITNFSIPVISDTHEVLCVLQMVIDGEFEEFFEKNLEILKYRKNKFSKKNGTYTILPTK